MITQKELQEIIVRTSKATKGPWTAEGECANPGAKKYDSGIIESKEVPPPISGIGDHDEAINIFNHEMPRAIMCENARKGGIWWRNPDDFWFLLNARKDVPRLCQEIKECWSKIEWVKKETYNLPCNCTSSSPAKLDLKCNRCRMIEKLEKE